jgi:hypothetical protein
MGLGSHPLRLALAADMSDTISPVFFSSATDEWSTPAGFFAKLNRRYRFTLDPCATPTNAKCPLYFTKDDDGLKQDWGTHRVFCNPPYGRRIGAWVRKCFEASRSGALVVLLVPARVDTRWFHDWIHDKANSNAPFPSMLAIYAPGRPLVTCVCGKHFIARSDAQTCSNACRQKLYRSRIRYGLSVTPEPDSNPAAHR